MLARKMIPRRSSWLAIRWNSSLAEQEALNYAHRKSLIQQESPKYYPSITNVRYENCVRIDRFRELFEGHDFEQYANKKHPQAFSIEGRIKSIRKSGKAMYFIDLVQDDTKVQIMASNKLMGLMKEEFGDIHNFFRKNDSIVCEGHPSRTNVGELSLKLTKPIRLASPCLNSTQLPEKITDKKVINKNRVLDYLVNHESRDKIIVKSHIIQAIRTFFLKKNFLEVQTPILAGLGTGANAEPFRTQSKALDNDKQLQLRVAPELWLKKLVIGGFDKVFEIGQSFRNEGIDLTHNPEFSTCEFYQSFTSLEELMQITEQLLHEIYISLWQRQENLVILHKQLPLLQDIAKGDYPKYEFVPTLEAKTGVPLPKELTSESLIEYHKQINLELPSMKSPASLLDNLSSTYLESISKDSFMPIFLYNQPAVLSPLSKSSIMNYGDRNYEISHRFELFINGKEYVNAYEEENSPLEQAQKFKDQQLAKTEFNDNEMLIPDWQYVQSMEYGLPPTGGWGCGIDRLSMLFTGSDRIEQILSFGNLRDVIRQ